MSGAKKFKPAMRLPFSSWLSLAIYLSLNYLMESCVAIFLAVQLAVVIISFQCSTQYVHIFAFLDIVNFLFTHPLNLINSTAVISSIVFIIVTVTTIKLTEYYKKNTKRKQEHPL